MSDVAIPAVPCLHEHDAPACVLATTSDGLFGLRFLKVLQLESASFCL